MWKITTMTSRLEEFKQRKAKFEHEIAKEGKSMLKEVFDNVFSSCPKLVAIRWKQFTPNYQDGDPCYFSMHGFGYHIAGLDANKKVVKTYDNKSYSTHVFEPYEEDEDEEYDIDEDEDAVIEKVLAKANPKEGFISSYALRNSKMDPLPEGFVPENWDDITKSINAFEKEVQDCSDIFKSAFGDDSKVTATREGFKVEHYDEHY